MNPETSVAAPMAELDPVESQSSPVQIETPMVRNAWTRDVEALCRALDAQLRASGPPKT